MDDYLRLSLADRRLACLQVETSKRLQAASVDKDFWIYWTLRELFDLPKIGERLTFKGGTSLSKAWGIIERFSEDIDIVVHKEELGFGGEASPERAPSKSKRKRGMDELIEACRTWVQTDLKSALAERIAATLGSVKWNLIVDPDANDGQCLLFEYPGAFAATDMTYVRPVVKIELGARSDDWPAERRPILPYVASLFPDRADSAAMISTLAAERTFWEKAMLLHEETFRPADKLLSKRMARHYYDVWCLISRGVAEKAARDRPLFDRAAEHREIFFRQNWVDYSTLRPGSLRLVPPRFLLDAWRVDYQEMAESMFYGERPSFDEVLRVIGEFERRFNSAASSSSS